MEKPTTSKLLVIAKRSLLMAICFIAFCSACFGQDVIITKDSRKIPAKVLEVNVDNIRYKKIDNEDGPIYTILKKDVVSILYQNGQTDIFTQDNTKSEDSTYEELSLMEKRLLFLKMATQTPDLYNKFIDGDRMCRNGNVLMALGALSTMGGIVAIYTASEDNPSALPQIGLGLIGLGQIFLAVGIPVHIVGKCKQRSALNEFHNQYNSTSSPTSHFHFNMNSNGVGVSYVFGNR